MIRTTLLTKVTMSNPTLTQSPPMLHSLYEADFYAWTQTQAGLLRQGDWQQVDLVNVIEEIEDLGRQERQQLRNRLAVLLGHLLKWQFQPNHRSKSWQATIREQRRRLSLLLEESPSLEPYLNEAIAIAYELGTDLVVPETPLDYSDLPPNCSYAIEQILNAKFWPE